MTRANSVEIGGRDSRTTSSMAWRNDEPARSALAISVIVSGSCLLNAPSRRALRRLSQNRGSRKPISAPMIRNSGLPERRQTTEKEHQQRDADDRRGPQGEELADLELQVGSGDVAGEVRAEVALLDDLVELGSAALWASMSWMPPWPDGALARRPCRTRSARGAR